MPISPFRVAAGACLFLCPSIGSAASTQSLAFESQAVARCIELGKPGLRTTAFRDKLTGATIQVQSEPFRLHLPGGDLVNGSEFRLVDSKRSATGDTQRLDVVLEHPARGIEAVVSFEAMAGASFMRKTVRLSAKAKPFVLRDIDVECLQTDASTDLGGRGQPIYLADGIFLGLEYPAGFSIVEQGKVVLRHHPGKTIGATQFTSKSAVLGAGGHDAFMRYVDSIRTQPRPYLLYNTWYDLRRKDMTVERLAETYEIMRKRLAAYGVTLAAFVPDDGWQDKQSIWQPDRGFLPQGYAPLADVLDKGGTSLGLWMPLTGVNLDVEWGAKQGYEAGSARHYCMSGPKYNEKMREVLRHHILQWRIGYFKHDFNSFSCSVAGHGHLPETRYGFEANVDAEIELLKYSRSVRPDIFLNVTSNMWLSPWWLPYADAIWMGCSDFGFIKTVPAIEQRDWAITYRDHHLWRRFRKERAQFPMTATMTHGVIYGRRNMLGGKNEPLDKWSDNVAWYFLRGMQMRELYITPELLTDAQWDVLGRACRWATDHAAVLRTAQLTLGDPGNGEVYGFASRANGVAFFGFRNPSVKPQTARIAARELIGDTPARLKLIYPFKCDAGALTPDDTLRQALGPNAIRIYRGDASPGLAATALNPDAFGTPGAALKIDTPSALNPDALAFRVTPLRSDLDKVQLVLLVENVYEARAAKGIAVLCDGKRVQVHEVALESMRLLHCQLPTQACTFKVETSARALEGPFRSNMGLSGWLVADYTGQPGPSPATKANLACPYASRRRMGQSLGVETEINLSKRRNVAVTEADLKQIRAAMLHVCVFGSNGEEQYAGKPILLNGVEVAKVPTSARPLDRWQRKLVPIPKDKLHLVRVENEIQFGNRGGDCYKLKDTAMAVQLKDGRWAETSFDPQVYCSTVSWLHGEGQAFSKGMSPTVRPSFKR